MSPLGEIIGKLEQLEPQLRTIDQLYESGSIMLGTRSSEVGDFRLYTWAHDLDGVFSAGCLQRVRLEGKPFPVHIHRERTWIMCSRGVFLVEDTEKQYELEKGGSVVIEPNIPHSLLPISEDCVAVFVTIPADAGYPRHAAN